MDMILDDCLEALLYIFEAIASHLCQQNHYCPLSSSGHYLSATFAVLLRAFGVPQAFVKSKTLKAFA